MATRRFIDHRNMDASKLTYTQVRMVLHELSQALVAGFLPNALASELARRTGLKLEIVECILSCELRYLIMKRQRRGLKKQQNV